MVDYPRLRRTITSRQPDLLLIQNYYGNLYGCDLGAKEYEYRGEFASPGRQGMASLCQHARVHGDGEYLGGHPPARLPCGQVAGGHLSVYCPAGRRALKKTGPLASYVTPSGTTLGRLAWGCATQSPDGRITYLHVLTPPAGASLMLPPPSD